MPLQVTPASVFLTYFRVVSLTYQPERLGQLEWYELAEQDGIHHTSLEPSGQRCLDIPTSAIGRGGHLLGVPDGPKRSTPTRRVDSTFFSSQTGEDSRPVALEGAPSFQAAAARAEMSYQRLLCEHRGTMRAAWCPPRLPAPVHGWEAGEEAATREKLWRSAIPAVLASSLQMVDLEFHIV